MTRRNRQDSVFDEPHLSDAPFELDSSEEKADWALRRVPSSTAVEDEWVEHTVWDEPTLTAGQNGSPPPPHVYADWLMRRRAETSEGMTWGLTALIALAAGPFAVFSLFMNALAESDLAWGWLTAVTVAPVAEEIAKTLFPYWIVEKRPYLFRTPLQIILCALAGGLAFATIENVLYLHVYIDEPSPTLAAWRWTICVGLHAGCSMIVGLGLMRVWEDTWRRMARPRLALAAPWAITGIVIHCLYNLGAVLFSAFEYRF